MSTQIHTRQSDTEHSYTVYVVVSPRAECAHGAGATTYVPREGVRIACPDGKDCWLVKLEFADG